MPRKNASNRLKILAKAIDYLKSCRENAPQNPELTEDLRGLEDKYHDELLELVREKFSTAK